MVIEQKLGENGKLFAQKLVRKVDGGIHYTNAMRANGVGNVANVDRVQMLVLAGGFYENLMVEVVQIVGDKNMDVSHDFQHIEPLLQSLRR